MIRKVTMARMKDHKPLKCLFSFSLSFFLGMGWGGSVYPEAIPGIQKTDAAVRDSLDRAVRLREEGKFLEAERQLVKALEENPAEASLRFEMANLYAARHDEYHRRKDKQKAQDMLERSAQYLEQTVMMDPGALPPQYNLGVVYKRLGEYEKAREQFKKVMRMNQGSPDSYTRINALMQLGSTYEEQGFFLDAKDIYEEAREMDYYNPSIRSALEDLEERRAEYEKAKAAEEFRRLPGLPRDFKYSDFSQAAAFQAESERAYEDARRIQQVLPYLGAMLFQQFLKKRYEDDW